MVAWTKGKRCSQNITEVFLVLMLRLTDDCETSTLKICVNFRCSHLHSSKAASTHRKWIAGTWRPQTNRPMTFSELKQVLVKNSQWPRKVGVNVITFILHKRTRASWWSANSIQERNICIFELMLHVHRQHANVKLAKNPDWIWVYADPGPDTRAWTSAGNGGRAEQSGFSLCFYFLQ